MVELYYLLLTAISKSSYMSLKTFDNDLVAKRKSKVTLTLVSNQDMSECVY